MTLRVALLALVCLPLSACFFDRDDHAQACESERDCPSGSPCYQGFCVASEPSPDGCGASSGIERCYEGEPAESEGVGVCQAGQRLCVDGESSGCLGQVLPQAEMCNGRDDDCDGTVDDVAAMSACDTHLPGACREGTWSCRDGMQFCEPARMSQSEVCNAVDDDCDDVTDEVASETCYPAGAQGCTLEADGEWHCLGLCATGQSSCDSAEDSCSGAVTPDVERCTVGTALAQDENCNGIVDEDCGCSAGTLMRDCYAGPDGTLGNGICQAGMQQCMDEEWGPCIGYVPPDVETCANPGEDDDCNGIEDDVIGEGWPCIAFGARGECRNGTFECGDEAEPQCVAGDPEEMEQCDDLDRDCDGHPNNGFDFNSDETCGSCDVECDADATCCEGECLDLADLQQDPENCGACGRACGDGRYCCQGDCLSVVGATQPACSCDSACGDRSCCGDNCRDLDTEEANCGACGRKCGRGEDCIDGVCTR